MEKFEIKYYRFWYRLIIGSGIVYPTIALCLLRVVLVYSSEINFFSITIFDFISIPMIILLFLVCYYRSINYLSSLEFGPDSITIGIHRYDKPKEITIHYKDLDIEILLNLFSFYNTYRLEFRKRNNQDKFMFDLIHKQYSIGYWTRSKQKELFSQIRANQGKLPGTEHIK